MATNPSFMDFPEDVQLNILSFLRPFEISALACTCRRFSALCSLSSPSNALWLALCDRRWGSKTQLRRWSAVPSLRLYKTLDHWEPLIGFWRRVGNGDYGAPSIVFFEWSSSCIIGSRVTPSSFSASNSACKIPFIWIGLSAAGETLSYLHPKTPHSDSDFIPIDISFIGCNHFVIEEIQILCVDPNLDEYDEILGLGPDSSPDQVMSEIYKHFANQISPGTEKSWRRHRKKERLRLGRRPMNSEHFVKISNC